MAASSGSARPGSRIAGIEGLRAFAAGAIVLLHAFSILAAAGLIVNSGWLTVFTMPLNDGVTLFFVLSGFLLWRPFASAVVSGRELPSLRRYARNRVLRILPAYWAVLALSALVLQSVRLDPVSAHPLAGALHDPALLLKDALLVQELAPQHALERDRAGLVAGRRGHVLCPAPAARAARSLARDPGGVPAQSPRRSARSRALLVLVALVGKLAATFVVPGPEGAFRDTWHSVLDRSFLTHADLFAAGMLVAVLRVEHEHGRFELTARMRTIANCTLAYAAPLAFVCYFPCPTTSASR